MNAAEPMLSVSGVSKQFGGLLAGLGAYALPADAHRPSPVSVGCLHRYSHAGGHDP